MREKKAEEHIKEVIIRKKNIANYNLTVHLYDNEELVLDEYFYPNIDINLKKVVEKTKKIINFEKRLLE